MSETNFSENKISQKFDDSNHFSVQNVSQPKKKALKGAGVSKKKKISKSSKFVFFLLKVYFSGRMAGSFSEDTLFLKQGGLRLLVCLSVCLSVRKKKHVYCTAADFIFDKKIDEISQLRRGSREPQLHVEIHNYILHSIIAKNRANERNEFQSFILLLLLWITNPIRIDRINDPKPCMRWSEVGSCQWGVCGEGGYAYITFISDSLLYYEVINIKYLQRSICENMKSRDIYRPEPRPICVSPGDLYINFIQVKTS